MHDKNGLIPILQEILAEKPDFFLPKNLNILTWKSKTVPNALITKVNGQRYLGMIRKDIKGQDYWKYKPLSSNSEQSEEDLASNQLKEEVKTSPTDNIAKFN